MPCYVVQLQSVEFKASNRELVEAMLTANDYRFRRSGNVFVMYAGTTKIDLDSGKIETTNPDFANKIKRQYSEHILKVAAKKKKWVLKKKASGKFVAKKW